METKAINVIYQYRWWFVKVNPRLLFPAFRKEHRKIIIANGKKRGYGEIRGGLVPLSRYELPGHGFWRGVKTFFRKSLGLGCKRYEKGYIYIKISRWEFIVLQRTTEQGLQVCEVYEMKSENPVGGFIFNQDFSEVYPHISREGMTLTLYTIIGYVADSMVYNLAASSLSREIKIVV